MDDRADNSAFRWGIRHRVVASYMALLFAVLLISIVVTRQTLLTGIANDIDAELSQEVEEFRLLANGVDPATGEPFGTDVEAIFDNFLSGTVPADSEAYYSFVDGEPFLRSFGSPDELLDDAALVDAWTSATTPTRATASTAVGEARYLAAPLLDDGQVVATFVVVFFPEEERDEALRAVRIEALAGLVALLITGLFAWSIAGRVLKPVRDLTGLARNITDTDLSGRIPVSGRDELSELSETFNAMIERLERGFDGQRAFLDDVAHELRTPITIARGHLELMSEDPVERAETLAIVDDELERMNRYVDDLLLLAKSETADFLQPHPVDLGELAIGLRQRLSTLADRDWVVDAAPAPGALAIIADEARLTQAILNLATNAVQHTDVGDTIAIGVEGTGPEGTPSGARLWVRDTGAGLEPGLAEHLFDRRIRGAASRASRADGLGIGLAIVAAIARAHHGTIEAANEPSGGARFVITLPTDPHDPAPKDETP